MSRAFSLFVPADSGYHRLNPLTKLMLTGLLLVSGIVLPGSWATYAVFGLVVLPLAVWAGVAGRLWGAIWRIVLPFAISLFLIQGLLWPQGTPILDLGPLSVKAEGVAFALRSTGRILMVAASFLLLALTTSPDALMIALTQRGFPDALAYVVVSTIQIVPRFQAKATTILDAQRARGLDTQGSLRQRMRGLLPLVGPLILGSIVDIEERAIALEARAFGRSGPKTHLMQVADSPIQAGVRWLLAAAGVGLILARLVWFR